MLKLLVKFIMLLQVRCQLLVTWKRNKPIGFYLKPLDCSSGFFCLQHDPVFMNSILRTILLAILSLSYFLSGYLKLLPIEYFENDILNAGVANEYSVLFVSRFIIGSEFVLGFFLLFRLFLKQTLIVSLWMLLVYTVYLIYLIIRFGNEGNCGCYGQEYSLTPFQGILKNILIAGVTTYLLRSLTFSVMSRWKRILAFTLGVLALLSPFIIYKMDFPPRVPLMVKKRKNQFW